MKHVKCGQVTVNLDKKWHHLSCQQRAWICSRFRERYIEYLNAHGRHPGKDQCAEILGKVYDDIQDRQIWIPFTEVSKAFTSKLSKYRDIQADASIRDE